MSMLALTILFSAFNPECTKQNRYPMNARERRHRKRALLRAKESLEKRAPRQGLDVDGIVYLAMDSPIKIPLVRYLDLSPKDGFKRRRCTGKATLPDRR
jgi:hypothetical protein